MDMTLLLIQDKQNEHSEKDGHDTFTDARYTLDEHSGAFWTRWTWHLYWRKINRTSILVHAKQDGHERLTNARLTGRTYWCIRLWQHLRRCPWSWALHCRWCCKCCCTSACTAVPSWSICQHVEHWQVNHVQHWHHRSLGSLCQLAEHWQVNHVQCWTLTG